MKEQNESRSGVGQTRLVFEERKNITCNKNALADLSLKARTSCREAKFEREWKLSICIKKKGKLISYQTKYFLILLKKILN